MKATQAGSIIGFAYNELDKESGKYYIPNNFIDKDYDDDNINSKPLGKH